VVKQHINKEMCAVSVVFSLFCSTPVVLYYKIILRHVCVYLIFDSRYSDGLGAEWLRFCSWQGLLQCRDWLRGPPCYVGTAVLRVRYLLLIPRREVTTDLISALWNVSLMVALKHSGE
jgi:hypothetical protein